MRIFGYQMIGVLLLLTGALPLRAAAPSEDGTLPIPGLSWGSDVGVLKRSMGALQPDLCGKEDKSYFSTKHWSCEGYVGTGRRVASMDFDVHLRMDEATFTLSAVTMKGNATGGEERRVRLVSACEALGADVTRSLGTEARELKAEVGPTLLRIYRWESRSKQTSAMLVCRDLEQEKLAEVQLDMEHSPTPL